MTAMTVPALVSVISMIVVIIITVVFVIVVVTMVVIVILVSPAVAEFFMGSFSGIISRTPCFHEPTLASR
ncbi:MAG: hypothetical protein JRE28_16280, partial [Deltaproteobacteria bacterium]|nr:hypothetical protein [Deltaproteobacteria bacterium]